MKGYRFYEELENKNRKGEGSKGTVIAIPLNTGNCPIYDLCGNMAAFGGVYNEPNSPVCGSSASVFYLRDCCRRISEAKAREIHPALFEYLEG